MAKKRNPNDATFRNITALKKRVAKLEAEMAQVLPIAKALRWVAGGK